MAAGYQPIEGLEAFPTDHLPALMRPTTWQWRGDFFDPELGWTRYRLRDGD